MSCAISLPLPLVFFLWMFIELTLTIDRNLGRPSPGTTTDSQVLLGSERTPIMSRMSPCIQNDSPVQYEKPHQAERIQFSGVRMKHIRPSWDADVLP